MSWRHHQLLAEGLHFRRVAQRERWRCQSSSFDRWFAVSCHPQGIVSQWRSPWADGWTLRYVATPRPCSEAMEGVSSVSRLTAIARSTASRASHQTSRHQARKRIGLLSRRAICNSGVSTPAGRDIRDCWRWRRNTPIAQPTGGRLTNVLWRSDGIVAIAPFKSYLPALRITTRVTRPGIL
jgi:hypothetical protein